jgi:hypothetical protein
MLLRPACGLATPAIPARPALDRPLKKSFAVSRGQAILTALHLSGRIGISEIWCIQPKPHGVRMPCVGDMLDKFYAPFEGGSPAKRAIAALV